MMTKGKAVVIGAGLSGAVCSFVLATKGKKVLTVEMRRHVGGNVFDYVSDGIIIQKYGPHIFHTDNFEVFRFLSQFTRWREYDHRVSAYIDDKYVPLPFNLTSLAMLKDDSSEIERKLISVYGWGKSVGVGSLMRNKDPIISDFGKFVYEKTFKHYTQKQWGTTDVPESVLDRVPVKICSQSGYFNDRYIYCAEGGFSPMIERMLSHKNIQVMTETDGLKYVDIKNDKIYYDGEDCDVFYGGRIDSLFKYKYGCLRYRTLDFKFERYEIPSFQPTAVVNYTQTEDYTRISEFTKFTSDVTSHTVIAKEYPRECTENDIPYYPICDQPSVIGKYFKEAMSIANLSLIGRLGLHKYINMDEAVAIALKEANKL